MRTRSTRCVLLCGVLLVCTPGYAAQGIPTPVASASATDVFPVPAPVAPAVINRDGEGRATVRATRLMTPLRIDGQLDEAAYTATSPVSDFIQNDPKEGAPATEKTEVWVFYDSDNVYVVGRCWETHPENLVANEMRRDNVAIVQDDQFAFSFDTFYDRRNALFFEISASGGRIDGQVTNERQVNLDWNPIWDVRTSRFDGGYIVETAIPFKSLRYRQGIAQVWGLQVRRHNMAKNEYSFLTPIPASVGSQGHFRVSLAATLVGIEAPQGLKNLDIKPYARTNLTTDRTVRPAINNDPGGDIGLDVKYGLTQSLAADFTVNTDFAQVEADEQQVNLTRFSLFFPEKRDFFLENSGIFAFGATTLAGGLVGDAPLVFYSRNVGLYQGREVPILAGGRVSGRAGRYTIGAVNVQTEEEDVSGARSTNFSVFRLKRDILRRSSVGLIYTGRSAGATGGGMSQAYGVDGSFSFGSDLAINTYWAQTKTDGVAGGHDASYRALLDYNADRYGAQVEHLVVDPRFLPEVGFARRLDMRKEFGMFRFSPRPRRNTVVRKYLYQGTYTYIESTSGRPESKLGTGHFETQFQNTDIFLAEYNATYEFLPAPFRISPNVVLPVGEYSFGSGKVGYNFGKQRRLSSNVVVEYGDFYNGRKTTFTATSGRVNFGPRLSAEPGVTFNKVNVTEGKFTQKLITSRVTYTMTPWMFASALVQYNQASNIVAANVRFRWEYQPGSELFVVFNEQRDTLARAFPDLANRAFIVKINKVFRYSGFEPSGEHIAKMHSR